IHGAPAEDRVSGFGGERRHSEVRELSPEAEAKDTELVPTRRMPSDAKWALWQAELEKLG
ncbi:MAG: hypothetical protein IJZ66_04195, partial [Oscillibacter sp.]|nr:hypothetical protein [Oscillibacter sp.]